MLYLRDSTKHLDRIYVYWNICNCTRLFVVNSKVIAQILHIREEYHFPRQLQENNGPLDEDELLVQAVKQEYETKPTYKST